MSLYSCPLTALFLCYYQGKTDCKTCFYSLPPISLFLFSYEPSSTNHCILFLHKTATIVVKCDLNFAEFNADSQQSSYQTWRQYLIVGHFQFLQFFSAFGFQDSSIIFFLFTCLLSPVSSLTLPIYSTYMFSESQISVIRILLF